MADTGRLTGTGGLEISARISSEYGQILTDEALAFLADLHREFEPERSRLLAARQERQKEIDAGAKPDFLESTRSIREADWKVAPPPKDLVDRRVEITGPVDRKMVINALNADVKVFMADFEDATSPTWDNLLSGQINLKDAVRRQIDFVSPEGKQYSLSDNPATLMVRPRGWHLPEKHVLVDGQPMSGSLFDFGLYFFHNAKALLERGSGPYFYLPKLESHVEARLWNDVFNFAQDRLGLSRGTIKATVLIETILAAFEMDEILYELRDHSAGLNCGRWDYIFSCIKKFGRDSDFCLADRSLVTMNTNFMRSYSLLTIQTCHRRGAHAMGGMAAQIPIKNDPVANEKALSMVLADKEREAGDGHDGTWVAHPGLAPIALKAFNKAMPGANQVERVRDDVYRFPPPTCWTSARKHPLPKKACGSTATWASSTWAPGWADWAACPSTTLWKTRPRRKSAVPRSGSGLTAPRACWTTAARSTWTCSAGCWPRNWKRYPVRKARASAANCMSRPER